MQLLDAKVQWMIGYGNNPYFELLVDKYPRLEDMRFTQKNGLYYAEKGGFVQFFAYTRPGQGFGGTHFPIVMEDGSKKILKGPWSSRAGVMNQAGFGPCADVSITDDSKVLKRGHTFLGAAVTLEIVEQAAKMCGVHLVQQLTNRYSKDTDQHQTFSTYKCVPYPTQTDTEWIVVPSMNPNTLEKPNDIGDKK